MSCCGLLQSCFATARRGHTIYAHEVRPSVQAARDNSYVATFGEAGYGIKAQQVLGQVRGGDFTRHSSDRRDSAAACHDSNATRIP
jgi:hypothetical protein